MLLPVAERFRGVGVNFNDEAVRPDGRRSAAEDLDQIGASAALAGIDDDRQVCFLFGDGHGRQVEGVARVILERADAALAENDIRVTVGEEIFGREEPFLDAHAHAAFEEHGLAAAGASHEQPEILRIAGPDLQDVGGAGDEVDIVFAEDLGDDAEAGFGPGGGQHAQSFGPEALEFVGGGARFVGPAAQDGCPRRFDRAGRDHELFFAFDRAGAGHENKVSAADLHAACVDDGGLGVRLAAGQFVAFLHPDDALHLCQGIERFEAGEGCFVPDRRHHRLALPADRIGRIAEEGNFADHFLDQIGRGVRTDDNNHGKGKGYQGHPNGATGQHRNCVLFQSRTP